MSWIVVGVGAALGMMQGARNERKQKQAKKERAAIIQYSPWTEMQDPGAPEALPDMFESGISGASTGAQLSGVMGKAKPSPNTPMGAGGENVLGSQDMAAQMGQMYGPQAMKGVPMQMQPGQQFMPYTGMDYPDFTPAQSKYLR
jgi:hypothetical protein